MAWCWGGRDGRMDDEIQPIYCHLRRNGWGESLDLLRCTDTKLPERFTKGADDDACTVIMRPVEKPTELFKALQSRDWGTALDCLQRNASDVKTWIYRESDFPENVMLWRLLPLHASIVLGAPAYLTLELLRAYPEAAKKWDLHRSLPIHLAASRIDLDTDGERVLSHLLAVFPESAAAKNGKGNVPIELAYGAQLRKDKQNKINSWCMDAREPEGGGFELQLEMRDVMESFKSNDKEVDPSVWSLGTIPTTSSFSTKSERTSYSFLNGTEEKLKTIPESAIPESTPNDDFSSRSSSYSSSASSTTKSIGFQTIRVDVNNRAQTSSSTLGHITFSTSSQSTATSSRFSKPSTFSRSSFRSVKDRVLSGSKSAGSLVSHHFGLSNQNADSDQCQWQQYGPRQTQSFDLISRSPKHQTKSSISLPPIMKIFTRSRSCSSVDANNSCTVSENEHQENTHSKGKNMVNERSCNPEDSDMNSSTSIKLKDTSDKSLDLSPAHKSYSSAEILPPSPRLRRSFDLLPKSSKYQAKSSVSLPPILKMSTRPRNVKETQTNESCDSSGNESHDDIIIDKSTTNAGTFVGKPKDSSANSLDLSSANELYSFPAMSLPSPRRSSELRSRHDMENGEQLGCFEFSRKEGISTISAEPMVSKPYPSTKQQSKIGNEQSSDVEIEPIEEGGVSKKYQDPITNTSSDTVATETSENECFLDQVVLTESYDEEQNEDVTDLRLLAVVRNSFDEKYQSQAESFSTESVSVCTQDAILADFVEEASSNIGREKCDVTLILDELRANKIHSMEDLLKLQLKPFYSCFADRELAMEMKRLLDEPSYEGPLDSTYELEDFLISVYHEN